MMDSKENGVVKIKKKWTHPLSKKNIGNVLKYQKDEVKTMQRKK